MCNTGGLGAVTPEGGRGQRPGHNLEADVAKADVLWLIRHITGWSAGSGCGVRGSHAVPACPRDGKRSGGGRSPSPGHRDHHLCSWCPESAAQGDASHRTCLLCQLRNYTIKVKSISVFSDQPALGKINGSSSGQSSWVFLVKGGDIDF